MRAKVERLARPVDDTDLSDLTTARRTGPARWVPDEVNVLEIPFDRDLTATEQEAVLLRLTTPTQEAETQQQTLEEVAATLAAYLAAPSTSPAQDKAQIKALTRAVVAVIARFQRSRDGGSDDD